LEEKIVAMMRHIFMFFAGRPQDTIAADKNQMTQIRRAD
jgi:hypothetical protein